MLRSNSSTRGVVPRLRNRWFGGALKSLMYVASRKPPMRQSLCVAVSGGDVADREGFGSGADVTPTVTDCDNKGRHSASRRVCVIVSLQVRRLRPACE